MLLHRRCGALSRRVGRGRGVSGLYAGPATPPVCLPPPVTIPARACLTPVNQPPTIDSRPRPWERGPVRAAPVAKSNGFVTQTGTLHTNFLFLLTGFSPTVTGRSPLRLLCGSTVDKYSAPLPGQGMWCNAVRGLALPTNEDGRPEPPASGAKHAVHGRRGARSPVHQRGGALTRTEHMGKTTGRKRRIPSWRPPAPCTWTRTENQ